MIQDPPDENNAPGSPRRFCYDGRTRRRTRRPSSHPQCRRRRRRRRPVQRDDHYIKYVEENNNTILSVVTEQHTEGSSKKTFKVLCQFRVLVEWKKGGAFEPLGSSLPHKEHSFWIRGRPLRGTIDLKTPRRAFIITQEERLRSSHAKEVRYTRHA